jgi:hypothetical protein
MILSRDKSTEASLEGRKYTRILDGPYRWGTWAAPKDKDGKLDHNKAMTGDDLRDFANGKLFPYLHGFKAKANGSNTSNTRSVSSSARSRTRFRAATTSARSSTTPDLGFVEVRQLMLFGLGAESQLESST